jgi:soluble lytic murein transglycosylase
MTPIGPPRPLPGVASETRPAVAPSALEAVAEEFEAMFLRQMLKQMRKAGDVLAAQSSLNSKHTETVREMHDGALADSLARRRQTGIANLLVRQLSPTPAPSAPPLPAPATPAQSLEDIANQLFGPVITPVIARVGGSLRRGAAQLLRLVDSVILHESAGQVAAVSPKGARGLMQLMPDTAREMAGQLGLPYDEQRLTRDGAYNKRLGTAYLSQLLARYDGEQALAVAAYNAGPSRVDAWLARHGDPRRGEVSVGHWVERIPFEETRRYTRKILQDLQRPAAAASASVFKPGQVGVALSSHHRRVSEDTPT